MMVPASSSLVQLPIVLAKELGFFTEEGLSVTLEDTSGMSKALQSLLSGHVEVVSSFHDQVLLMSAEGRNLKAFVLLFQTPGVALVASPSTGRRIRSIADLKGSTVAVTSPGSPVHLYVEYLLAKNGLSPESVSVIGTPNNAARVAALERGKVGAAILGEPGLTVLQKRHPAGVTVLADLTTPAGVKTNFGSDIYPGTVLLSTGGWLSRNPGTARRLARAVRRSLRWCHEHNSREIAERMPVAMRIEDRATYEESIQHIIPTLSPDGVIPREAVEAEKRMLSTASEIVRRANIDVTETYTNEYLSQTQSEHPTH